MNLKVRIENLDRTIDVPVGEDLRRALLENDIPLYRGIWALPPFNCQGHGLCGKCVVEVVEGAGLSDPSRYEKLRAGDGCRLACQARVYQDAVIRTLAELPAVK